MVIKITRDKIKAVELSKTITKRIPDDIRKHMKIIEEILNNSTCMKIAKRTLRIFNKQLYSLNDEHGQNTNNRDKISNEAQEFIRKLCSCNDRQTEDSSMETMNIEVLCISTSEI